MFKKMPFVLLACIAVVVLTNGILPVDVKSFFYSISLTIKSIILFFLPYVVFCMIFKSCVSVSSGASKLMLCIFSFVCVSNCISTSLGIAVGHFVYKMNIPMVKHVMSDSLVPMWDLKFPDVISTSRALFAGAASGILCAKFFSNKISRAILYMDKFVTMMLSGIVYLIPLFVTGFFMKLQHDGTMSIVFHNYLSIFAVVVCTYITYVGFVYFWINKFNARDALRDIKNMLPAAISGFSTTSSASCMPITIMCASNNVSKKEMAECVIPATVNIHLVGDCIAIPIFAFAILKTYGVPEPSFYTIVVFALNFVMAKFSVVAVTGGSIFVMISVLESCFGFTSDMSSLIAGLYMMLDPFGTFTNIFGNAAITKLVDRSVS